jgi:NAD/NADP transhydrogenase beta subunit
MQVSKALQTWLQTRDPGMAVTNENLDDDKGPKILAVLWTLTGLTAVMVAARMFIRLRILKNFGIDDYLIAVSMIMSLAYCGVTTAGISVGYGKHAAALTQANFEMAILLNTISFLFGILSFTIPKLAVTAMLTRILNPGLIQKIWLWFLVGAAAAVSCICIIILFTMCDPPEALWHVHLVMSGEATCKNVWILIDYAIFTGGMSPWPLYTFFKADYDSQRYLPLSIFTSLFILLQP